MSSSRLITSSIEMRLEGRIWVMIFPTLGEPRPLEVGEANPEVGVADSISGSEILGCSTNSLVGEILPVTLENEIGS